MDYPCGAAMDLGTTTLALRLFSLGEGRELSRAAAINPQTAVAADVIGRMSAAIAGGGAALQQMAEDGLAGLLADACGKAGISMEDVTRMVIAGNTTMLYLLTGMDPKPLSRAPFRAETLFGENRRILGREAFLPRCMDAFVGADLTCAVLASGMTEKKETALLADIGTNGEIALWHREKLYATSTAAGPAFEGASISCGCGAMPGAIDRITQAEGRLYVHTIGDQPPKGLCGSGLIDAVAALRALEELDTHGNMVQEAIPLCPGVVLTREDIRQVQLAKGAMAAGMFALLEMVGVDPEEVGTLYIAGEFGSHLNVASAAAIGLIPRRWVSRTRGIGNAALDGAGRMLLTPEDREKGTALAKSARPVRLGGSPRFERLFMKMMNFE